ncbi:potassium transporter TrkA [Halobaculum limi]|uniref:potassium transporter TrkA n=1 Tax=Halobaculum limi TaxID=3031916 RepID=UPI0024075951|nr:potassium transporter TrkA [Halobaculum sp. YSMS11]
MTRFATARLPVSVSPLQSAADVFELVNLPRLVGFAAVAFLVAAIAAAVYRWYVSEPVPRGLTTLLGTATVAVYLNTVGLFSSVLPVGGVVATDPFAPMTVLRNVVSLLVAAGSTPVGRRAGDAFATNVTAVAGGDRVEGELSRFARRVGRIRPVELPDEVSDIDGYDPVDDATRERLAGETLLFPRRLSDAELRDRLVTRLKEEYGVGHVDAEFDGTDVTRLAVGRRMAGIGPTLEPSARAVAVRADPPNGAGPGDVVQVWRHPPNPDEGENARAAVDGVGAANGDEERVGIEATESDGGLEGVQAERVATAELRAVAGDVVTLAVDAADVEAFDADGTYRLVTMPRSPRTDREFASLLRLADETMAVLHVEAGSALDGATVGEVTGSVVAVESADRSVQPIPPRGYVLAADETVYLVARPETLREVERRATADAKSDTAAK